MNELKIILKDELEDVSFTKNLTTVVTSSLSNLDSLLNEPTSREENYQDLIEFDKEHFQEQQEFLLSLPANIDCNFFSNIIIVFQKDEDPSLVNEYIKKINKPLKIDINMLSIENVLKLESINWPKGTLFYADYNLDPIPLHEIISMVKQIMEIQNDIKLYNFSPLEQLIYLYDILKERVYIPHEDSKEKYHSRDLSKVLKEKEIVCLGYSNIFMMVALNLGIPTFVQSYEIPNTDRGHASNVVALSDNKYNIHGYFEFDVTWDAKTYPSDDKYTYSYSYCANPLVYAYGIKKIMGRILVELKEINYNISYQNYLNMKKVQSPQLLINATLSTLLKRLIYIASLVEDKEGVSLANNVLDLISNNMTDNIDKLIDKLTNHIDGLFKNNIPYKDFMSALYTVRKIKHSKDPEKYPLNIDNIMRISKKKYYLKNLVIQSFDDKDLRKFIFKTQDTVESLPDLQLEDGIELDSQRMKLIHTLRKRI